MLHPPSTASPERVASSAFGTTTEPAGGRSCFEFAGLPVAVASDDEKFLCLVDERYGAFATMAEPGWEIAYRLTGSSAPDAEHILEARQEAPRVERCGDNLRLSTSTFEIELDRRRQRAQLVGPLATYPLDRLIQTLCYEAAESGLILHAAALREGERGFLLCGPSGSGKSTLAALFPERALCDEFVAVQIAEGTPRLTSLPFWKSRRGSADIEAVYLLRHGSRDQRRRLGAGEAVARLRREVLWPAADEQALRRAFDSLFELVAAVPVWDLAFRPTRRVWFLIGGESEGEEP